MKAIQRNRVGKERWKLAQRIEKLPGYDILFKLISKISIRRRLIIFFLVLSILPIAFIGFLSYNSSKDAITSKIAAYSQESLIQATVNLELKMKKYEELSMQFLINSDKNGAVVSFVNDGSQADQLKETLKSTVALDEDIRSIFVGSLKDDSCVGAGFEEPGASLFKKFKISKAFEESLKAQGQIYWDIYETDVVMVRIINNFATGEPIGVYGVVFYGYKLTRLTSPSRYDDANVTSVKDLPYTMIVKLDGKVLTSPEADDVGRDITMILQNKKIREVLERNEKRRGMYPDRVNGEGVLVTYNQIGNKNWYLLGISSNTYLFREIQAVGMFTFILVVIISFFAVVISILVSISISNPLDRIKEAMKDAENGNLGAQVVVKTQDELAELGKSFNLMTARIGELIKDTQEAVSAVFRHSEILEQSSDQSAKASQSVAAATGEITKGTMEQTTEAEKTSHQMEELAGRIEQAVSDSGEVQHITDSIRSLSVRSKDIVEMLMRKANETDQITDTIANDINELNVSAEEIRGITEVITNIAEQTNLLGLNAAIEAARAGEMGLGFAVVSEEVNKLAAQSQVAARTINTILQGIQAKTEASAQTASEAHKIVEEQLEVVKLTQKAFDDIIEAMDHVVEKISGVSKHIIRINDVKDETLRAIINISSISEESAAASQEVSASIQEQLAIAEQVKELANQLRTMSERLVAVTSKFQI